MRLLRSTFYVLLLSLLGTACEKDVPTPVEQLPPITTEGANTFACLLNGEYWTNTPQILDDNITISYGPRFNNLTIQATRVTYDPNGQGREHLTIGSHFTEIGTHPLGYSYLPLSPPPCDRFLRTTDDIEDENNFIHISKLDKEDRIISGTFQFTVIDTICQDTFRFTEGRFDYRYSH